MTPQEFAIKIRERAQELQIHNRPLNIAAASVHSTMAERIFVKGETASGGQIGNYSTKDIWVNPNKTATPNSKGFNPLKGKKGATDFKRNPSRKRKTSYFEGWKGLRAAQGLPTNRVDLNFTGDMFFDFSRKDKQLLQRVEELSRHEYASMFSREGNAEKASGNEKHFGAVIFKLSRFERAEFYRICSLELKKHFDRP